MSEVLKPASAGTMESSDVLVELVPAEGREIQLTSVVEAQFGESIRTVAGEMLDQFGLVERPCPENDRLYRDMLIFKKGYALTSLDKAFIDELVAVKRELGGQE